MIALVAILLLASGAPDAATSVGAPKGTPLSGAALEKRTMEISALLRCPVCQGMAVADSPAEMAINMKGQVHDLLARGYTEEQILDYFEHSYGQYVLLKPEFKGVNTLVWLLPIVALVIGAFVVLIKMKKLEQPAKPSAAPEDPYLARVRELTSGEKQ